jgi:tRNA(fMet)-specific endonuclease VapC
MGIKYLLDTNILSELSKDKPNSNVIANIYSNGNSCSTAALVIHELNYGIKRLVTGKLKKNLQQFLKQLEIYQFQVLPYDNTVALYHATERARLVSKGLTSSFIDGQIASIAVSNHLTLVTRNIDDFKHFTDLSLENWFQEN